MNIVVEKQPKCVAILRAEIPAETVTERRDKIVNRYASKARIPGFRPGKAPKAVVAKKFGSEVQEELAEILFSEACQKGMEQEDLKVIQFGAPVDMRITETGCTFETTLTLAPDFKLPEYKGVSITIPKQPDIEAELEKALEELRQRQADFQNVDGRAAKEGDFLVCDYSSTLDGKPTSEAVGKDVGYLTGRENFWIKVDEASFLPGFATQVTGIQVGETREFPLTLPEDFPISDLSGKELQFKVEAREIKEAVLPELNDELAAKVLPGQSLEQLKDLIRENIRNEQERRSSDMKVNKIVEALLASTSFEVPEALVRQETQSQADSMVDRGIQQGLSNEEIAAHQAEIFNQATARAESNLRSNFILQEIARAESLVVADNELLNHLAQIAMSRKEQPKKLIKQLANEGRIEGIRRSMLIGKAIDFLLEHANVSEADEPTADSEATA
ncbi:MAG: trigger factor [Luteolibacter sp.]|jgi:trigger factor